jgi:hypothetical protein
MKIEFSALTAPAAEYYRSDQHDANGQPPEHHISDGGGNPCRHCLNDIPAGKPMLVLSHRPFKSTQPYSEIGPIFLCANACPRHPNGSNLPPVIASRDQVLIRGYDEFDRIVGGSGHLINTPQLIEHCLNLFEQSHIAYIHLRSAANGCYQCCVDRI